MMQFMMDMVWIERTAFDAVYDGYDLDRMDCV